jgi:3-oxoacyl-[acyl-carrier-protein] synthase II
MGRAREVVITGVGVVSPIGIGNNAFWSALVGGRSGVRTVRGEGGAPLDPVLHADVQDFDPKAYIRPRKSLKVMSRDIQLGFTAAELAAADAGLDDGSVDPERLGVVFGAGLISCDIGELAAAFRNCMTGREFEFGRWGQQAMAEMFPLWMLKYLPNMPACHIGIARDARGPNNSLTLDEVSGLAAVAEATRVIERGQADAMFAGGTNSDVLPTVRLRRLVCELSQRYDAPQSTPRPFDAQRDGIVQGEGAAAFLLEERSHAENRGAAIRARVAGTGMAYRSRLNGRDGDTEPIRRAIQTALDEAGMEPEQIGHVNANGQGSLLDDRIEAQAIRQALGDVPVTAPQGHFGNLEAAAGAVEMAASLLAFEHGQIPPTLNYESPDPECPANVVHGVPAPLGPPTALLLNRSNVGTAAALILRADND